MQQFKAIIRHSILVAVFALPEIGLTQPSTAAANPLPGFKCVTGGLPTTSFVLTEKSDSMELSVIHHNGAQYAPIFNGMVTAMDLSMLNKEAEFHRRLGDRYLISFKKERCKFQENKFHTCVRREAFSVNSENFDSAFLATSETTDRIPDAEFTRTTVRLYLTQNGVSHTLDMNYLEGSCEILGQQKRN